jgi:hypothetical protein
MEPQDDPLRSVDLSDGLIRAVEPGADFHGKWIQVG